MNIKPIEFNDTIKVRLSKELKERFQAVCKSKAVNASELLRQYIEQYAEENAPKK